MLKAPATTNKKATRKVALRLQILSKKTSASREDVQLYPHGSEGSKA